MRRDSHMHSAQPLGSKGTGVDHFAQSRLLWMPPAPGRTRVDAFRRAINHKRGLHLSMSEALLRIGFLTYHDVSEDYNELHAYSVSDYSFWIDLWEFLGISCSVPPNPLHVC